MSFRIRRVKWREVLQSCAITKLILILSLNHGRPRNRKLNEILELLYIKKKTIIITASNLIENTTNYSSRYPFRPEFWWEFSKNFSAIFFFVPKKCFESVFLSLISKTNTALVWRFFFSEKLHETEVDLRAGNGIITFECEGLEPIGRHPLHLRIAFVPKQCSVWWKRRFDPRRHYSEPWLDPLDQIVPWSCELVQWSQWKLRPT